MADNIQVIGKFKAFNHPNDWDLDGGCKEENCQYHMEYGWYWRNINNHPIGPFETKELAIENMQEGLIALLP